MAEPTFVSAGSADGGTDGTHTEAVDVGSGTNRTLVVGIHIYDTSFSDPITVSTATYNGSAMTERKVVEHQFAGGLQTVKVWEYQIDNPDSGTNNLVVTLSEGNSTMFVTWAVYTGANNGAGTNTASATGNITDHEYDIVTTDADGICIHAYAANTDQVITAGTGTTVRAESNPGAGNDRASLSDESASGGTDTVGITTGSATRSVSGIFEILPSAGAPAGRTTKNTVSNPLGLATAIGWRIRPA